MVYDTRVYNTVVGSCQTFHNICSTAWLQTLWAAHMIPAMTKKTAHKQELGRTATQAFIIMCSDRVAMIKQRGGRGSGRGKNKFHCC